MKSHKQYPIILAASINITMAAHAAPPTIDPATADLTKPVDGCVVSSSGQTAESKMKDILSRQGRIIAVEANKLGVDGKGGLASTKFAVAQDLRGGMGYIITSSHPLSKDSVSDGFCFTPVKNLAARPMGIKEFPAFLDKGLFGTRQKNLADAGTFSVAFGRSANDKILAVSYNAQKNYGALTIAGADGSEPKDFAYYRDLEVKPEYKALLASAATDKAPVKVN